MIKFKNIKSNTIGIVDQNFEKRKTNFLKYEIEKINKFKKILTKNSKIYSKKYGEEILQRILTTENIVKKQNQINHNIDNNIINNNKNNANNEKNELIDKTNNNNNIIIIETKPENKNSKNNTGKKNKKAKKRYSLNNINFNIINSFKICNNDRIKRRNSDLILKKRRNKILNKKINKINSNILHHSLTNLNFTFFDSKLKEKSRFNLLQKINYKSISKSYQIEQNISFNIIIDSMNKNKNKINSDIKIGFYTLLVNALSQKKFEKFYNFGKKEEIEEEKKRFLYQLFYCLELSKIYIFNFKQNKNSLLQSEILLFKPSSKKSLRANSTKNVLSATDIKFKPFYEIFSDYSQIKISTQLKYEAYPNIEHINQYYIFKDKLIGKGGSSMVYLCEDNKQKKYAIKITSKNLKANPFKKIYDYVKEEVLILKRIHSKYIVTTYEVIESKNKIYIIMEYMGNGSVFNIIEYLDENKIKQYTRNLISAVEYCHEIANIIHKDINVNNLLINEDGVAKLCDFGISETFEDNNDTLLSKGPSTYTPPEKKYNEKYKGKPADIYLIGLTLYHMVYKNPLFTDFGNLTINDYLNINIPKKDSNNKDINKNLINLMENLLKFNPEERPKISKLKKDPWLTDNMKNPFPDVIKEALFYSLELTKRQIKEEKNVDSSNIEDDESNEKNKVNNNDNKEQEEEEEEESSEDSEYTDET